jgi:hypothetical protein
VNSLWAPFVTVELATAFSSQSFMESHQVYAKRFPLGWVPPHTLHTATSSSSHSFSSLAIFIGQQHLGMANEIYLISKFSGVTYFELSILALALSDITRVFLQVDFEKS